MRQFVKSGEAPVDDLPVVDDDDDRVSLFEQMQRHKDKIENEFQEKFRQQNQPHVIDAKTVNRAEANRALKRKHEREDEQYIEEKMTVGEVVKPVIKKKKGNKEKLVVKGSNAEGEAEAEEKQDDGEKENEEKERSDGSSMDHLVKTPPSSNPSLSLNLGYSSDSD